MTRPAGRPITIRSFDLPICSSGKRAFKTEGEVKRQLDLAQVRRRNNGPGYKKGCVEAGYYECCGCKCWHLTSEKRR